MHTCIPDRHPRFHGCQVPTCISSAFFSFRHLTRTAPLSLSHTRRLGHIHLSSHPILHLPRSNLSSPCLVPVEGEEDEGDEGDDNSNHHPCLAARLTDRQTYKQTGRPTDPKQATYCHCPISKPGLGLVLQLKLRVALDLALALDPESESGKQRAESRKQWPAEGLKRAFPK